MFRVALYTNGPKSDEIFCHKLFDSRDAFDQWLEKGGLKDGNGKNHARIWFIAEWPSNFTESELGFPNVLHLRAERREAKGGECFLVPILTSAEKNLVVTQIYLPIIP